LHESPRLTVAVRNSIFRSGGVLIEIPVAPPPIRPRMRIQTRAFMRRLLNIEVQAAFVEQSALTLEQNGERFI